LWEDLSKKKKKGRREREKGEKKKAKASGSSKGIRDSTRGGGGKRGIRFRMGEEEKIERTRSVLQKAKGKKKTVVFACERLRREPKPKRGDPCRKCGEGNAY